MTPTPPPPLKDSERGGREGSEMRLDTLFCSAGELCLFSLERSSTWDRVTHRCHSQRLTATSGALRVPPTPPRPDLPPVKRLQTANQTISPAASVEGKKRQGVDLPAPV